MRSTSQPAGSAPAGAVSKSPPGTSSAAAATAPSTSAVPTSRAPRHPAAYRCQAHPGPPCRRSCVRGRRPIRATRAPRRPVLVRRRAARAERRQGGRMGLAAIRGRMAKVLSTVGTALVLGAVAAAALEVRAATSRRRRRAHCPRAGRSSASSPRARAARRTTVRSAAAAREPPAGEPGRGVGRRPLAAGRARSRARLSPPRPDPDRGRGLRPARPLSTAVPACSRCSRSRSRTTRRPSARRATDRGLVAVRRHARRGPRPPRPRLERQRARTRLVRRHPAREGRGRRRIRAARDRALGGQGIPRRAGWLDPAPRRRRALRARLPAPAT